MSRSEGNNMQSLKLLIKSVCIEHSVLSASPHLTSFKIVKYGQAWTLSLFFISRRGHLQSPGLGQASTGWTQHWPHWLHSPVLPSSVKSKMIVPYVGLMISIVPEKHLFLLIRTAVGILMASSGLLKSSPTIGKWINLPSVLWSQIFPMLPSQCCSVVPITN